MRRCPAARVRTGVALGVIASILATVTLIALVGAPGALADGDPASDVLVDYYAFVPRDAYVASTYAQLNALLVASQKAGFPIRVALIGSPGDLGTVTALWDKPGGDGGYAWYLWTELSNLYDGQILVVMPNGFGLYGPRHGPHAITAAEAVVRARSPGPGPQLALAALAAVPALAKAAGHQIPTADIHVQPVSSVKAASTPLAAWLALALGGLLIAACWRASLKARPLNLPRQAQP